MVPAEEHLLSLVCREEAGPPAIRSNGIRTVLERPKGMAFFPELTRTVLLFDVARYALRNTMWSHPGRSPGRFSGSLPSSPAAVGWPTSIR
jgi:hypothetical protein